METGERYGQLWSIEETTLALFLYCQIPFEKTFASNPAIQSLAVHLGRTPSSVARKLGNLGSFDPVLKAREIVGLSHASKTDKEVWDRYDGNWSSLVDDATLLWNDSSIVFSFRDEPRVSPIVDEIRRPEGPSDSRKIGNVRLHQAFFRRAVLTSYGDKCCACGLEVPSLLVASHIVPWSQDEELRTDPTNGLCLCALHDRAFDRGLIAVSNIGQFVASSSLRKYTSEANLAHLLRLDGLPLTPPARFAPDSDRLDWHLNNVFQAA